jgi:hypothetical protein
MGRARRRLVVVMLRRQRIFSSLVYSKQRTPTTPYEVGEPLIGVRRVVGYTECAGINRHVVGDERDVLQIGNPEQRGDLVLAEALYLQALQRFCYGIVPRENAICNTSVRAYLLKEDL